MLYTDGCFLIADTLPELFQYGRKIGLNADWVHYMGKTFHPHFDICGNVKKRVLADEKVKKVTTKEIVRLLKLNYRLPENEMEEKEWEAHNQMKVSALELPSKTEFDRMFQNILSRTGLDK